MRNIIRTGKLKVMLYFEVNEMCLFLFLFSFEFSALYSSHLKIKKLAISIFFCSIPYHIYLILIITRLIFTIAISTGYMHFIHSLLAKVYIFVRTFSAIILGAFEIDPWPQLFRSNAD